MEFSSCNGYSGSSSREIRSHSSQGLSNVVSSSAMKIPLPPRLWITDFEDDSSDASNGDEGAVSVERSRVRSRYRHYKQRSSIAVPIGIFWDIENCQVPRGCSAIDVVSAIRNKFLTGRREADFVVVCDVRKEQAHRLQELNDAQVSLIHVCGTQKNAADEKLRQCMRRFGELHTAPAALLLISGDINFAADLSDFRHRKNMEVILVHKQNTSSALIACASSNYSFNELTAHLPRNPKSLSQTEEDEEASCEMEVTNLPIDQPTERVSRRLRRLADNCGGKVLRITAPTAMLRFPTPDHASRALKRMDGEDVFGRKISTRYARAALQPTYSSDEGYSTAPPPLSARNQFVAPPTQIAVKASMPAPGEPAGIASDWALALQHLPAPTPPPRDFVSVPRPRKIRGTHGSVNLDRSGCSSSNSGDECRRETSQSRAVSPWNCSGSVSEHSDAEETAELTVTNLPPYDPLTLQEMLSQLFSQYVTVLRVSVWGGADGPLGVVLVRSEWEARLAIARIHKRRLDHQWSARRLELTLGRPSPAPNLDVLRARLRAILLEQSNYSLPLLRLRDAYASRHCCALTTSDLMKVKDTVIIHDGFGRIVQLVDLTPVTNVDIEEAPWKCRIHATIGAGHEDGSRILQPVYMEIAVLAKNVQVLLENHGGILPLLTIVECYESCFPRLIADVKHGVPLELLLRSVPNVEVKETPSRHITWRTEPAAPVNYQPSESSRSSCDRERPRTAPALEPMLTLFERELIDLLRSAPRCCIAFSKLIPAFHHHFGRQCRVADYGFTKLPDLLAALSNTIVVLGSGSSRMVTISAAAQSRRWTSDLVKLLRAQPGRIIHPEDIPQLYQGIFGKPFSPVDYGVCTVVELMQRVNPQAVIVSPDGTLALPRPTPTPEEKARTVQFAMQAVELLCYTPNLRMEFSRFVPAYHAHFGRQLRVAHYGCVKLVELFEMIPEAVTIGCEPSGERSVQLAPKTAKAVIYQRLSAICPIPLTKLSATYTATFGAPPVPSVVGVTSLEALVVACGGAVAGGIAVAGSGAAVAGNVAVVGGGRWAGDQLRACGALAADRSIARRSTQEYFVNAFRRMCGYDPNIQHLEWSGVIEILDNRISLTPTWRCVWRLANILAEKSPLATGELVAEYTRRYEPNMTIEMGNEIVVDAMRTARTIFVEQAGWWSLAKDVSVPRDRETPSEDYSQHDTPPGQKGSRVFESPKTNIWCSPPASALPTPTAFLSSDFKRRTRLAAQFDTASLAASLEHTSPRLIRLQSIDYL